MSHPTAVDARNNITIDISPAGYINTSGTKVAEALEEVSRAVAPALHASCKGSKEDPVGGVYSRAGTLPIGRLPREGFTK